jgi:signal transduction histidine kinase
VLVLACRSLERDRLQHLADAREQLIAAVSHELRTPLTPIVGFSELLLQQREQLTDGTRQAAEVIHRNGRHLTSLVDDLLQVSRNRQEQIPVDPATVRLDTHLAELVLDREHDGIELQVPTGTSAWVDRTHLTQIVTNLLDNAVRYGRAPIVVSSSDVGDGVEVQVTDHGEGVPDWFVAELFDEFAQATKGDRRSTLGLGLGLSIARTLAQANGAVLTHRPDDRGACFVLTLPRAPITS